MEKQIGEFSHVHVTEKKEKKSDFQFRCQSRKHLKFMITAFS